MHYFTSLFFLISLTINGVHAFPVYGISQQSCRIPTQFFSVLSGRGGSVDKNNLIENLNVKYILNREVSANDPAILLDFILKHMSGSSRNQAKQWLVYDSVAVNDEIQNRFDVTLYPGDVVAIQTKKGFRNGKKLAPSAKNFIPILYEDNEIIVVDKPPGIVTAITTTTFSNSLNATKSVLYQVNRLLGKRNGQKETALVCHIHDLDTSGVLVFSKTEYSRKRLLSDWGNVGKTFVCLTEGRLAQSQGTIESYLNDTKDIIVVSAAHTDNSTKPKRAVLYYRTIESTATTAVAPASAQTSIESIPAVRTSLPAAGLSLLEVSLETFFRDQLRVQLSSRGTPVCGDGKYGAVSDPLRRVAIHCTELRLTHPVTGSPLTVRSAIPMSFRNLLRRRTRTNSNNEGSEAELEDDEKYEQRNAYGDASGDGGEGGDSSSSPQVRVVSLTDFLAVKNGNRFGGGLVVSPPGSRGSLKSNMRRKPSGKDK